MTCQGDPPPLSSVRVSQVDSMHGSPDQLAPRARHLLRTLIARYIQDGEPVGSQTLARVAGLEVSPATIRNILGDLEDLGLLASPHTSAGRVPTAHGYRVFVDSLLQMQPPGEGELARLRQELAGGGSTQALLGSASELLSAMSHFVGVVSAPRREQFAFRQIDFVALDGRRVLAILVFADNEVQNRVIETRQEFAPGQLEQVANYLNAHFAGLPMAEIRTRLLLELRDARSELEQLLAHSIELAEQALQPAADDMLVAGQTRLMGVQDLSDLERLRELFELFSSKREILQLLERTIQAPGVRIFIGEETGMMPLQGGVAGHRPLYRQWPGAGRAGRDRPQADGLRPDDPAGPGYCRCTRRGVFASRAHSWNIRRLKRSIPPTLGWVEAETDRQGPRHEPRTSRYRIPADCRRCGRRRRRQRRSGAPARRGRADQGRCAA